MKFFIVIICLLASLSACQKDEKKDPSSTPTPSTPAAANANPIENFWILYRTIDGNGKTDNYTNDTSMIIRFKGNQVFTIFMDNGEVECRGWRTYSYEKTDISFLPLGGACAQKDWDSVRLFGQINNPQLNMRRIDNRTIHLFNKMSETDFNQLIQNKGYSPPQ